MSMDGMKKSFEEIVDEATKEGPDFSKLGEIKETTGDDWGGLKQEIPEFTEDDLSWEPIEGSENLDVKSNGPEDQAFEKDKLKPLEERGEVCDDIAVRGKPMPDGVSVNHDKGTKIYWEDKRPSETKDGGNSWLSTYSKKEDGTGSNDPIAKERIKARDEYRDGKISKAEAEGKVIIAENDDHYSKKGEQWSDPTDVNTEGYTDKLGVRMPDTPQNQGRIDGIIKELNETGRNPEVMRENGVAYVIYDLRE